MLMEQITSIVAFFDWKRLFFSKSCPGTIAWSSKAGTFSFFGSSLESYHFLLFQDKKKEQCRNGIHNEQTISEIKLVETESIIKLILEVKLKWSFHRISCKFFRNRVSLFREI